MQLLIRSRHCAVIIMQSSPSCHDAVVAVMKRMKSLKRVNSKTVATLIFLPKSQLILLWKRQLKISLTNGQLRRHKLATRLMIVKQNGDTHTY